MASTTPAMDACISIVEILENVLRFLDVNTLLLAQRTSRHFKDVITGSIMLQRKLFFLPATFDQALETAEGERRGLRNWIAFDGSDEMFMLNPAIMRLGKMCTRHKYERHILAPDGTAMQSSSPLSLARMFLAHPMPEFFDFDIFGWESTSTGTHSQSLSEVCISVRAHTEGGVPRSFGEIVQCLAQILRQSPERLEDATIRTEGKRLELRHVFAQRAQRRTNLAANVCADEGPSADAQKPEDDEKQNEDYWELRDLAEWAEEVPEELPAMALAPE